jgi:hypothetical protein
MTEPTPAAPAEPWQPANAAERAMADALAGGDKRRFFEIVMTADLYLPAFADTHGRGGQQFLTGDMEGVPYLLVFTSAEALVNYVHGAADAFVTVSYDELRRGWPHPSWLMAINPGTPLDAYLSVEDVERVVAGDLEVPRAAELMVQALEEMNRPSVEPGDTDTAMEYDTDTAMRAAVERGDLRGYLDALSIALLVVPTLRPVEPEALLEPDFPWRVTGDPADPVIEVFTSVQACAQALGPAAPHVTIACPFVMAAWPPESYAMVVDPNSAYSVRVPGDRLPLLLVWPGENGEYGPEDLLATFAAPNGP